MPLELEPGDGVVDEEDEDEDEDEDEEEEEEEEEAIELNERFELDFFLLYRL